MPKRGKVGGHRGEERKAANQYADDIAAQISKLSEASGFTRETIRTKIAGFVGGPSVAALMYRYPEAVRTSVDLKDGELVVKISISTVKTRKEFTKRLRL